MLNLLANCQAQFLFPGNYVWSLHHTKAMIFFCKCSLIPDWKKSFHGNRSSSFLFLFPWVLGNPRIMWRNGITVRFVLRSFCGLSFLSFGVGDLQITECFWCLALRVRCHGPCYEICLGDNVAAEGYLKQHRSVKIRGPQKACKLPYFLEHVGGTTLLCSMRM